MGEDGHAYSIALVFEIYGCSNNYKDYKVGCCLLPQKLYRKTVTNLGHLIINVRYGERVKKYPW